MDPLSALTVMGTCFALTVGIVRVTTDISTFARDATSAASDLDLVSNELRAFVPLLDSIIGNLKNLSGTGGDGSPVPDTTLRSISAAVDGSKRVVDGIATIWYEYKADRGSFFSRVRWASSAGDDMQKLRSSLEAWKSALSIGLQLLMVSATRHIKDDTAKVLRETEEMKAKLGEILHEMRSSHECERCRIEASKHVDKLTSLAEPGYPLPLSDEFERRQGPQEPQNSAAGSCCEPTERHQSPAQEVGELPDSRGPESARMDSSGVDGRARDLEVKQHNADLAEAIPIANGSGLQDTSADCRLASPDTMISGIGSSGTVPGIPAGRPGVTCEDEQEVDDNPPDANDDVSDEFPLSWKETWKAKPKGSFRRWKRAFAEKYFYRPLRGLILGTQYRYVDYTMERGLRTGK
ncbi:hypothetical protein QBC46DRAFT_418325 [Diplogelasinospora grovesii]|uniref:Fungal N-terminal domain-containing protein n=1 Tax=Diplogelasinospora grovesii TaxID=303347 RepID=A0AAN6N1K7_9PEZI|nr:hypothetical protein QBC46DRAFT_418325 [Diplogelasinospora grovesii]